MTCRPIAVSLPLATSLILISPIIADIIRSNVWVGFVRARVLHALWKQLASEIYDPFSSRVTVIDDREKYQGESERAENKD